MRSPMASTREPSDPGKQRDSKSERISRAHERARVQNVRDFPQPKRDNEINDHFLLNEHGDPQFLFYKFNENNILNQ